VKIQKKQKGQITKSAVAPRVNNREAKRAKTVSEASHNATQRNATQRTKHNGFARPLAAHLLAVLQILRANKNHTAHAFPLVVKASPQ